VTIGGFCYLMPEFSFSRHRIISGKFQFRTVQFWGIRAVAGGHAASAKAATYPAATPARFRGRFSEFGRYTLGRNADGRVRRAIL